MCRSCTSLTPGWAARKSPTAAGSIPAGTASIARSMDSRSRPQVPARMTPAMTRPSTGSTQSQPVARISSAPAHHPGGDAGIGQHVQVGAAAVDVGLPPRANSRAVPPLTTMPAAATQSIQPVATGSGASSRWTDSSAMAPTATSSSMALASAARMVPRWKP